MPRWFALAVVVNYPWEMAQAFLYAGMPPRTSLWWHCLVASLGDGALVLTIFAVVGMAVRRRDWFVRPGTRGYAAMLASGLALAVGIELLALRTGRWSYTPSMPLFPWPQVGAVPVLQMLLLPPLIFYIAGRRGRRCADG